MARLVALATGNFATLGTWGIADATSLLDSETNSQTLTTAFSGTRSVSFTPGAITVAGICVKLRDRSGTTGTMSVHLADNATHTEVPGTLVTINTADLPSATQAQNNGGWIYLEFATPVTLAGATAYEVEATTSSASQVNLYRNATAGNIARLLVTTANPGSLAAGDSFDICKRYTGAGAATAVTVTMDNTATTDFGPGGASGVGLTISGATLTFGTTAATNYYLKLSGALVVYSGGTLNMGTTGTPMPADATAVLEFDPGSDGECGLTVRDGGTWVAQGAAKTPWRLLAADASVGATSLTVDSNVSGWRNGDDVAIATTTRTRTQSETKALSADANGTTSLSIAALTNAHDGGSNGPRSVSDAAEVANITRNVKVRSATSTLAAFCYMRDAATVDVDYVEFRYIGYAGGSTGLHGLDLVTITGDADINGCVFRDGEGWAVYISGTSANHVHVSNCVAYNMSVGSISGGVFQIVNGTSGTDWQITDCVVILTTGSNAVGFQIADVGGTFTGNRVAGSAATGSTGAIHIAETGAIITGTFSGLVAHGNAGLGLRIQSVAGGVISDVALWRNTSSGLQYALVGTAPVRIDGGVIFGNASPQVDIGASSSAPSFAILDDVDVDSEAGFSAAQGIAVTASTVALWLRNCRVGGVGTHSTADVVFTANQAAPVYAYNCAFGSTTEVSGLSANGSLPSFLKSERHDQSATTHKSYYRTGVISADQTTRHTASGFSWRMQPASASEKLILPGPFFNNGFKIPCVGGVARDITVYVRKDGTYNGNAPRLVVPGGMVQGIAADVTDSLSVGTDTWEQLSVTVTPTEDCVVTAYVDCDGTAGSVYVDDAA